MNQHCPFLFHLDPGIPGLTPQSAELPWIIGNLSYAALQNAAEILNTDYYYFWPEMFTVTVNTAHYEQAAKSNTVGDALSKVSGYQGVLAQQARGIVGTSMQKAILLSSPFFDRPNNRALLEKHGFNVRKVIEEFQASMKTITVIPKE